MKFLSKLLILFLAVIAFMIYPGNFSQISAQATPTQCATPGKDGEGTVNANVNTYYSSVSGTINAGATTITVGSKFPSTAPDISVGDLLLIIQMQDADFNSSNTDAYGDNTPGDVPTFPDSQPSQGASGWTNLNNAGRYEFVTVTNVSGNTIEINGPNGGLIYTYRNESATAAHGRRSYQIIRVPQYTNATLSGGGPEPWNGTTGGVFVIDVSGELTLNGGVVLEASGTGFRGGAGRQLSGASGFSDTDYRTPATATTNGSKGEGIAGTPRYVLNYFDPFNLDSAFNPATPPTFTDNSVEGYPNGSYARGAPGNAGGGSTDGTPSNNAENSGGGGGGNGGGGGRGGRAWNSQDPTGGFGGKGFNPSIINGGQRLFMGGGGGAGTTNNGSQATDRRTNSDGTAITDQNQNVGNGIYSSGAAGGGIIIIRAATVAGNGTIHAQGAPGLSAGQDGAGGGGAGGTVYVDLQDPANLSNITVDVRGGDGGWSNFNPAHGPGGGGGGGVVVSTNSAVTIASGGLDGGLAGSTGPNGNANPPNFDGQQGTGLAINIDADAASGITRGADCLPPQLQLVKRITAINGQTATKGGDDLSQFNEDGDSDSADDSSLWPDKNTYLTGGIDGGEVEPGDEIEYTIYYLSSGGQAARNVTICDLISEHQTYIRDSFDSPGGGTNLGIAALIRETNPLPNPLTPNQYLTNLDGDDEGSFFDPGRTPPSECKKPGSFESLEADDNTNGLVVVDVVTNPTTLPPATSSGDPPESYGFIRFRTKVD
ncbi:MAG: hypothetical protein GVY04_16310 [Cyanobacteria bacterium]|jgi:uncharacterized repeat protein (TIGR01451 family)|nr:hypothetical protein [Cyanobacteria bacterium GSL.Bin1]